METIDARSLTPDEQEELRIKACKLIRRYNYKPVDVAKKLGVSRLIVEKWINANLKGGKKALRSKRRGRPKAISLPKLQAAQINRFLLDYTPEKLGLPFYLWNINAVTELIKNFFNIKIPTSTLNRYLRNWKYIPQDTSPRQFCREIIVDIEFFENYKEIFCLEKDYRFIYNLARREKATVFWCNVNFLRYDYPITPAYDLEGKPIYKPIFGRRIKYSTISAITNRGSTHFMVFKQKLKPLILIDFLERLIKQTNRKVFAMMDSHRTQRFRIVMKWLGDNSEQIRLFPITWPIKRV
jgi:transposase